MGDGAGRGPPASGGEAVTTNQRMEIQAVLEALRSSPTALRSTSCPTRRTWSTASATPGTSAGRPTAGATPRRKPVANADLWRPLIELVTTHEVTFGWVRGHSGDPMNDLVDQMAVAAVAR